MVRGIVLAALLLTAAPVGAQTLERVEGRVKKLESEMRAVQRKVFPGAARDYVEPEITAPVAPEAAPGVPASTPINDLTRRVDSLERQMTTLTGQVEEASFKVRQLEAQLAKFKTDAEFRLTTLEGGAPPMPTGNGTAAAAPLAPVAPGAAAPAVAAPAPAAQASATPTDPIEAEYLAAYAHVTAREYGKAEQALAAFVAKHPRHARASNAQYWLGRTYFAQNQPVQAARTLLENYQKRPEGQRAAESLLWLGKSLMAFSPPSPDKACEAYAQMQDSYGKTLTAALRTQLTEARAAARCG